MTRLDHNRASSQLAKKCGVDVVKVKNVIIWGNHSSTQFPDAAHAVVDGKPAPEVIIVTFVVVNFKIEILIDNFVSNTWSFYLNCFFFTAEAVLLTCLHLTPSHSTLACLEVKLLSVFPNLEMYTILKIERKSSLNGLDKRQLYYYSRLRLKSVLVKTNKIM